MPITWDKKSIKNEKTGEVYWDDRPDDVELMDAMSKLPNSGEKRRSAWDEFKRDIPALIGGIAGPLLAGKGKVLSIPAGMIAAGVGGAIGESAQIANEAMRDLPEAPKSYTEGIERVGMTFGEQAAFEGVGQLAVRVAAKAWGKVHPKLSEDAAELINSGAVGDVSLSLPQRTDAWWVQQLEGLTKGSLTGSGVFAKHEAVNKIALKEMQESLLDDISTVVTKNLSDEEIGALFISQVSGGKAAFSAASTRMHKQLDTVAKSTNPIDMGIIQRYAAGKARALERIGGVGAGDELNTLMKQVAGLSDNMSFQDASHLRSNLLSMSRDMEGKIGAGKAKKYLGEMTGLIDGLMEKTAKAEGKEFYSQWRGVNKFYKTGKEEFSNKFIAKIMDSDKTTVESIGDKVFRDGNVTEIKRVKTALKAAAKYSSKSSDEVWGSMQTGYLEKILSKTSDDQGEVVGKRLSALFKDNRKYRTLKASFSMSQREALRSFGKVAQIVQRKPEGGLGMLVQLAQGGALIGLAKGVVDTAEAATLFVGPRVLAKALTNPKVAKMMTTGMMLNGKGAHAIKLQARLASELVKIQTELGEGKE